MDKILILRGILIAWWWVNFTPWQNLLKRFIYPLIYPKDCKPIRKWQEYIIEALGCFKCQSFWWTLIISQDIFAAILAALIAYTYDKFMNSLKQYF